MLSDGRITEGSKQNRRNEERFIEIVGRESARKMEVPANFYVPTECEQFVQTSDAPILSGVPIYWTKEEAEMDAGALLRRQLSERAPGIPITLALTFKQPQSVSELGSIVDEYQIDGLLAELIPNGNDRIRSGAELSIHGGGIQDQVAQTNCLIQLGRSDVNDPSIWFAKRAQISMTVAPTRNLITDQRLESVRLVSEFAPGELDRIRNYYDQKAARDYSMYSSVDMPAGCESYFQNSN